MHLESWFISPYKMCVCVCVCVCMCVHMHGFCILHLKHTDVCMHACVDMHAYTGEHTLIIYHIVCNYDIF